MMRTATIRRGPRTGEEGYMLVAVIFMLAILIIGMAVAVPKVREEIQHDREVETMNRGKQYIRAIKLYYKKFHGTYPPNIDALVKTNEIRFLRKRYIDPITRKDDWKPIMFGQNKAPIAMGFFGQPLMGGSPLAGTGPGGVPGASPIGGSGIGTGLTTSTSSPTGAGSTTGTDPTASGSSTTSGSGSSSGSSSIFGSSTSSNQTFGGGGIIGFSPDSPKESILVYKKKTHYNEWEFVYSPLMDQATMQGGNMGTVGQSASGLNGNNSGLGGNNSGIGGIGGNNGGIGSSTGSGLGSFTPTQPTPPSTPNSPQ